MLKIDYVRRTLETFSGFDVLLNGAVLGRRGIDTTAGLIVVCRGCQTSLQNNAVPASALCRLYSPDDVVGIE